MIRIAVISVAVLALAACSTTPAPTPEPIVITKDVDKPVAVSCVPKSLGPAPAYPDTDDALRTAGSAERTLQLVFAGRDLRKARSDQVEPVIENCRQ